MLTFKKFLLTEKLITFNNKAYPKFNQAVILAGGAGSGKGFVLSKLLGIQGKVVDVDALKTLIIKSKKLNDKIKQETGYELSKLKLSDPNNVSILHDIIGNIYKLDKRNVKQIASSLLAAPKDRKPNIIFDVTLKDISKLKSISNDLLNAGYEKKNIHIVWVLNKFDVAIEQNKNRSRVVSDEILLSTHEGASLTMNKILNMGNSIKNYMDGDIHIVFNQVKIDSELSKSSAGGSYIKEANYITVKKSGKSQLSTDNLGKEILSKIQQYVPKTKSF